MQVFVNPDEHLTIDLEGTGCVFLVLQTGRYMRRLLLSKEGLMALIVLFGKYAKGLFTPTLTLINAKTRVRISSFFDPQRGRVLRFEESGVEGLTAFYDLQIAQVSPSTLRAYLFREYLRLKGSAFAGDGLVLTEQSKLDLLSPKRGTS